MPRDGSGNFTLPANTQAVSGDPISSTKFNTLVQDLEADANTDRPIVAGGTGASTALAARANLGLEIGVNVQAYDAGLASIAGLTTLADRSIYTTASDTYAVYTLTAAGRAILDDADAAAQRTTLGLGNGATTTFSAFALTLADDADAAASRTTLGLGTIATQDANNVAITGGSVAGITDLAVADGGTGASDAGTARTNLGLGTAAVVNTGTSGATIPLLNAANTFSGNITITNTQPTFDLEESDTTTGALRAVVASGISYLQSGTTATPSGDLYFTGKAAADIGVFRVRHSGDNRDIWHAGNDGAGSGLDADTLDGVQGSSYATLTGSQTLTNKTLTTPIISAISNTGTLTLPTSTDTLVGRATTDTLTNKTISGGTSNARVIASTETTGTLTVASANETIQATGDITIPNAVFAAGDIILIYAGASSRTITEGASVTMRLGGSSTTGSRTLAARGVAVLFFVSSSEVVVSGGAVT
jgi:hypothetical protein